MNYEEQKVRNRMDPARIPRWSPTVQPWPFWLYPAEQIIRAHPADDRIWTHPPIHDPAWSIVTLA